VNQREAIEALVNDLNRQIDQLGPRGIKDKAGNPYNPSYYKRGLQNAIERGGTEVAEYVRRYLKKPPSDGYKKLEDADALDLACEALVADGDKPYAHLFSEADREVARARLAPHIEAIAARKRARAERINGRRAALPSEVERLRDLAENAAGSEDAIAINSAILAQAPTDGVAMNRLGRAFEALGMHEDARLTFERAVAADPDNAIAARRLRDLERGRNP
jgi:tetratricopeptide (TPR) repeat protein